MDINRRRLLSVTMAAAVAGCSGSDDDGAATSQPDTATDTPTDTPTETATDTPTPEPAEFQVASYETPDRVEIDEKFTISITVENTGGQPGSFTAPIYLRTADGVWQEGSEWDFGTIQPGESATFHSEPFSLRYINRYEIRLGQASTTTALQTVSASLAWGTEYQTPGGYVVRVDEPTLQETYEYEDYSGNIEERAPESGGQWAFVNMYVKNETGSAAFSPLAGDFALVSGSSQYDSQLLFDEPINKGEKFDGGELQPGVERSGWVTYAINSGLSTEDLRIAYSESTFDGEIAVNWQTET